MKTNSLDVQKIKNHGGKTALLVGDEALSRQTNTKFLEKLGFKVLQASDGDEALRVFKENPDRIFLSLLDWVSPGLNGLGTIRKLRELNPVLPVILSSGYPAVEALKSLMPGEEVPFIQKPYTLKALNQIINRVLKV